MKDVHASSRTGPTWFHCLCLAAPGLVPGRRRGCLSPETRQWEPFPTLTDEFDGGKLDESKWFPTTPVGWTSAWLLQSKNVRVADGMLHLDAKKESLRTSRRLSHVHDPS